MEPFLYYTKELFIVLLAKIAANETPSKTYACQISIDCMPDGFDDPIHTIRYDRRS